jgi:ArsR family transcriptional regulator
MLAPVFHEVLAVDRSAAQLERARRRLARRAYTHVDLFCGSYADVAFAERVQRRGGADAVFASRVLHHAPRPAEAIKALAALARPGGAVVVIDYARHEDERLRDEQADVWLGFAREELEGFARSAGLCDLCFQAIPRSRSGSGPDGHLDWQAIVGRRPRGIMEN